MDISGLINNIVSISQFNKGQASPIFSRAKHGETLLVIKNNSPVAVIISPEEYEILRTIPKLCSKLINTEQISDQDDMKSLLTKLKAIDTKGESHV